MGFGCLRSLIRPLSKTLTSRVCATASFSSPNSFTSLHLQTPWTQRVSHFSFFAEPTRFDRLTDSRFQKRRPVDKPRRKRASIRPPGPYAWVKHVPNEPIKPSSPNKGSVKLRNEKKRRRLRREFILSEAKKRKAQMQEAKRKKLAQRVERKMAKVAREREWAHRLVELQRLEQEKKTSEA